ncbi:hypothetical protein B0H13DRAFT_2371782 [Mycena leptocephala]|nr:hypothetical protein B0H13DRAFT_2371782 [Mycena leptocephala]
MAREKRKRTRIPKSECKNLRFWAEGARETILAPHLDPYATALDQARVDWKLQDHEEPVLKDFDPKAFLPPQNLPEDEEKAKCARVEVLNQRIRRWFLYRLRKLRKLGRSGGLDPSKDPYAVLLAKLSGVHCPPKARQAYQQFMHEAYTEKVAPVVAEKWAELLEEDPNPDRTKEPKARFRAQIAREVFAGLEEDERREIGARAKEEATEKKAAYQKALKNPPSKQPNDRQKCIDTLPDPLMRGAGPLNMGENCERYTLAYGQNHTAGAHTWPQWNKTRFTNEVLNFLTEYLQTAFTVCRASLVPAATFAGAKYTIPTNNSDSESDSDSDIESDIDLQSDSEDESDEEILPKKRNAKSTRPAKAKRRRPVREKNMAQHRALAEQLKASFEEKFPELKKPEPKKRAPRKPKESTGGPTPTRSISDLSNVPSRVLASALTQDTAQSASATADAMDVDAATDNEGGANTATPLQRPTRPPHPRLPWIHRPLSTPPSLIMGVHPPQRPTRRPRPPCSPYRPRRHPPAAVIGTAIADPTAAFDNGDALQAPDPPPALHPLSTPPLITAAPHLTCCTLSTPPPSTPAVMDTATVIGTAVADPTAVFDNGDALPAPDPPPRLRPHPHPLSTPPSLITAAPCRTHPHRTPSPRPPSAPAITTRTRTQSATVDNGRGSATTSSGAAQAMQPKCPPKAAAWFVDAHAAMTMVDLGCHFQAVIVAWTRVEAASKYEQGPTKLSTIGRPEQVKRWVAGAGEAAMRHEHP